MYIRTMQDCLECRKGIKSVDGSLTAGSLDSLTTIKYTGIMVLINLSFHLAKNLVFFFFFFPSF